MTWYRDPHQRGKYVTLAILFFVNLINYMDRLTVSAILSDVSHALCPDGEDSKCTTAEEGFLQTAFVVVYLAVAPIFGYLGDRYSRKLIMAGGILIWGGLSLTASFMQTYWSFLAVRASIAIGESSFSTIAPTVLGDLFEERSRAVVLGVFYIAIPVGSGLGYVIGGAPEEWRNGLRITPGLCFLSAVLILFFLADPPRGNEHAQKEKRSSYLADLKYIVGVKSFLLNVFGFTCVTFMSGSLSWYGPSYIKLALNSTECKIQVSNRTVCEDVIDPESVDFIFGAIIMASGIIGVLSGMFLSRFLRPKYPRIDSVICGTSLLICVPILVGGMLSAQNNLQLALGLVGVGACFLNMNWSVAVDMSLYVIVPTRRATAEAIHLMASHALGEAGAPYVIGLISDGIRDSVRSEKCTGISTADCDKYRGDLVYYLSLQRALFLAFALLCLGGLLYEISALWIKQEKEKVDSLLEAQAEREKMNEKLCMTSEVKT